jgi:hypothetical protein
MIAAQQCGDNSADCVTLGTNSNLSIQRGTVLLAMSRSWIALANQKGSVRRHCHRGRQIGRLSGGFAPIRLRQRR